MLNFCPEKKMHHYLGGSVYTQTPDVKDVNEKTLDSVLLQFELKEEIAIAQRAERNLGKAIAINPDSELLRRFWMLSKATAGLTEFYHHYHYALVYNNISKTVTGKKSQSYHDKAVEHINKAMPNAQVYYDWMHKLNPYFNDYFTDMDNLLESKKGLPPRHILYGQLCGVKQQCLNAYARIISEPLRAKKYPYLLFELDNPDDKFSIHGTHYRYSKELEQKHFKHKFRELSSQWNGKSYNINLNDKTVLSKRLPAITTPWILPQMDIEFEADLSKGGMLVFRTMVNSIL